MSDILKRLENVLGQFIFYAQLNEIHESGLPQLLFTFIGVQCVETGQHPYYRCGACPSGWTGNGTACKDIDEVIIACSTQILMHYLFIRFISLCFDLN